MPKYNDLTGKRIGHLVILGLSERIGTNTRWNCLCDCGKETIVLRSNLVRKRNNIKSCGCFKGEDISKSKIKHGHARVKKQSPEYRSWAAMIKRCTNPKDKRYPDYGGRGIKVCDRWRESFENFLEDMGNRPSLGHSIERVENNRGYSPDNCKWASHEQQNRNKRIPKNNTSGTKGIYWRKDSSNWEASISVNGKMKSLGRFKNKEDAIAVRKEAELIYYNDL